MSASKKKDGWREALRDAVDEAGSLSELGRRCGCKHSTIIMALKGKSISAELAFKVAAATAVPLNRLRPDLWPEG